MADFIVNISSTTARSLIGSESGFVGPDGILFIDGSDAVEATTGTNWLHVLGTIYAYDGGFAAVDADGSVFEMVVGEDGYISAENPTQGTLDIDVSTHFDLVNHGVIHSPNDDAINFAASGGDADFYLRNFGSITAYNNDAVDIDVGTGEYYIENYGDIAAHRTAIDVTVSAGAGGDHVFRNEGSIQTIFDPAVILGTGASGNVQIVNTGSIIGSTAALRIVGTGSADVVNSGLLSVEESLAYALDLTGGDDEVINTGRIIGNVSLGEGADLFDGREGSVSGTVQGGLGDDSLFGSDAADDIDGGADNDELVGGGGEDFLIGGTGDDNIRAGEGEDTVAGNDGNDTMRGGDAYDRLFGGADDDVLAGNDGDDYLRGGTGADSVYGGSGEDDMGGGTGDDYLEGGLGDDIIRGNDDNDTILGGRGQDTLAGQDGNDFLIGGSDDDRLIAGTGQDTLTGGTGADVFVWTSELESPLLTRDQITDFEDGVDMIDLSDFAGTLTFLAAYTGTAGEVRYNDSLGRLYIDVDGDLSSDFAIDITGAPTIDETDLIL